MKFSTITLLAAVSSTAVAFAPHSTTTTTFQALAAQQKSNDGVFEQQTSSMPAPPMPIAAPEQQQEQFMEPVELTGETLLPAVPPSPEEIYQARSETVAASAAMQGESPRWGTLEVQKAQQMTGITAQPATIVTSIEPVMTEQPSVSVNDAQERLQARLAMVQAQASQFTMDDAQERLQSRLATVQAQASQFAAPLSGQWNKNEQPAGKGGSYGEAVNQFTAAKIEKAQATVAKLQTYKPVSTAVPTIIGTEINPPYQPKVLSASWNKAERSNSGAHDVSAANPWLRAKYAKVLEQYNAQGVAYETGSTYQPASTGAPTIVGTEVHPPAQPKPLSVAWDKGYKGN